MVDDLIKQKNFVNLHFYNIFKYYIVVSLMNTKKPEFRISTWNLAQKQA